MDIVVFLSRAIERLRSSTSNPGCLYFCPPKRSSVKEQNALLIETDTTDDDEDLETDSSVGDEIARQWKEATLKDSVENDTDSSHNESPKLQEQVQPAKRTTPRHPNTDELVRLIHQPPKTHPPTETPSEKKRRQNTDDLVRLIQQQPIIQAKDSPPSSSTSEDEHDVDDPIESMHPPLPTRTIHPGDSPEEANPTLPTNVLVSILAPFFPDRMTLNHLAMTSKEMYEGCRDTVVPPWPDCRMDLRTRLWSVAFSPDGLTLALGGTDGRVRLVDRRKGWAHTLLGHLGRVYSIVFTQDGKTMVTGSGDGEVRIWNMEDYTLLRQVQTHTTHLLCLALDPQGTTLATGGEGDIQLYSIPNGIGLDVVTLERNVLIESVTFSPCGTMLAAGTGGHSIHVLDMPTHETRFVLKESSSVHAVAFSPDGQYLVAGTDYKDIRVWNLTTHDYVTLVGHQDLIWSVAFSPDGRYIATGGDDGSLRIWNASSGKLCRLWKGSVSGMGMSASVYGVSFSPDNTAVAATRGDGKLELRPFH